MFVQRPLPYAFSSLEPFITGETLAVHYEDHHGTYTRRANEWLEQLHSPGLDVKAMDEGTFLDTFDFPPGKFPEEFLYNFGQHLNHFDYWESMTPFRGTSPQGTLSRAIEANWGSMEKLKKAFITAGMERNGSSWVYLAVSVSGLFLISTSFGWSPRFGSEGAPLTPLICCDLWEHAYYLDYQSKKEQYLNSFWQVINWTHASKTWETWVEANGGTIPSNSSPARVEDRMSAHASPSLILGQKIEYC